MSKDGKTVMAQMMAGLHSTFPTAEYLLVLSLRAREVARRTGRALQPSIAEALSGPGCEMLAPVLDALLRTFEAALRQPVSAGTAEHLSADERILITLIEAAEEPPRASVHSDLFSVLDWAIWSARVMIAKGRNDRWQREDLRETSIPPRAPQPSGSLPANGP